MLATGVFLKVAPLAQAQVCAMCTIAIAGGLGISRMLGVDDALTGVWLGAAIVALASFVSNACQKRWPAKKWVRPLVATLIVTFSLLTAWWADQEHLVSYQQVQCIKAPCPGVWHVSNLAWGMIIGAVMLGCGEYMDKALRKFKNDGGRPYFPFQKVVVPVVFIILGTLMAYFLVV